MMENNNKKAENKINEEQRNDDSHLLTQKTHFFKEKMNKIPIRDRKMWVVIGFFAVFFAGTLKTVVAISKAKKDRISLTQDSTLKKDIHNLFEELKKVDQSYNSIKDSVSVVLTNDSTYNISSHFYDKGKNSVSAKGQTTSGDMN